MKYHIHITFLTFNLLLFAFNAKAQQLKLGNSPSRMQRSAVLQLDSKDQGLLLTRVPDTNAVAMPVNGMVIYFTDSTETTPQGEKDGMYIRKNGQWHRLARRFEVIYNKPTNKFYFEKEDVVTLNIRNASGSLGVVSISTIHQTFYGDKIFLDSIIAESRTYAKKLLIQNAKNIQGATYFLTTDNSGEVQLQDMNNGYWKSGGNILPDESDAILGKTYDAGLSVITDSSERLHITSEGKTGINTSFPTDTLEANGSFQLGTNGSSFESMGEEVMTIHLDGSSIISGGNSTNGFQIFTNAILKIEAGAWAFINPREDLNFTSVNGTLHISIAWVRTKDGILETGLLCHLTGGSDIYTFLQNNPQSITFDVFYCNSK